MLQPTDYSPGAGGGYIPDSQGSQGSPGGGRVSLSRIASTYPC